MMTNAKIGTALVGGYVLGRTKKAKLAIGLGMFLAGKKLPLNADALRQALWDSPVLGELNSQVREQIVDATRTAAKGALVQRASGLADTLHQRTQRLQGARGEGESDEEPAETAETADHDEDEQESGSSRTRRTARRSGAAAGKAAGRAAGPTRKAATRGAKPAGKAGGKAAGKTAGTARKTAAQGTSSRRTRRGGDEDG